MSRSNNGHPWADPLDVDSFALWSVTQVSEAADALARHRGLAQGWAPASTAQVRAAFSSHEHLRVRGRELDLWAPLSRFHRCADGWVRLHANYPHHRAALQRALGTDDLAEVTRILIDLPALEVERGVRAERGLAAVVRTAEQWRLHPQGTAVQLEPLVDERPTRTSALTQADRRALPQADPVLADPGLPMSGLSVLDLTRVIAGPTATRVLGALGADVLRVDPLHLPELADQFLDTGFAKRSAAADLRDVTTRTRVLDLVAGADVLVTGYRPGALAPYGLDPAALLDQHPGITVVHLAAWGWTGPWSHERGFDSIVQAASGIAALLGDDERPGQLPAQALDHAAGYLMAAAAMRLVTLGGGEVRVSLARMAAELLSRPAGAVDDARAVDAEPATLATIDGPHGELVHVPPPLLHEGRRLLYPFAPPRYGADQLSWRDHGTA